MAVTRGGKKRFYKRKGGLRPGKMYQEYCREQYRKNMVATQNGRFGSIDSLGSEKIRLSYEAMCRRLGPNPPMTTTP